MPSSATLLAQTRFEVRSDRDEEQRPDEQQAEGLEGLRPTRTVEVLRPALETMINAPSCSPLTPKSSMSGQSSLGQHRVTRRGSSIKETQGAARDSIPDRWEDGEAA